MCTCVRNVCLSDILLNWPKYYLGMHILNEILEVGVYLSHKDVMIFSALVLKHQWHIYRLLLLIFYFASHIREHFMTNS